MKYQQSDPVKWIIWGLIVVGLIWSLFFVKNGPQFVANGVRLGSILMLGAIGLSLTYKILNFANFAHGDILIFGAYGAFSLDWLFVDVLPRLIPTLGEADHAALLRWIALGLATVGGAAFAVVLSLLIDKVLYRRMRRSAAVVLVIASFGMALFVRNLVQAVWGVGNRSFAMRIRPPMLLDVGIGTIKLTTIHLVTIAVSLTLVVLMHLFLKYTKTGKAMRAMSDNSDLARVSGINTEHMIRWTWAIGSALSAVAGVFIGINFGIITPNTGNLVLLPLFSAVILGGIGSPYGAMLGALVIGIAQTVLVAPVTSISSQYKPGVAFLLMIIMLLVRPQGLLGEEERRG